MNPELHTSVNTVLIYLADEMQELPARWIERKASGNESKPIQNIGLVLTEINRLNLVKTGKSSSGEVTYLLTVPNRNEISNLPNEFSGRPYEYFLDKEAKVVDQENQTKWYLAQDAKQKFDDYPTIKTQRNLAIGISIIAIVVSIVLGILQSRCK